MVLKWVSACSHSSLVDGRMSLALMLGSKRGKVCGVVVFGTGSIPAAACAEFESAAVKTMASPPTPWVGAASGFTQGVGGIALHMALFLR